MGIGKALQDLITSRKTNVNEVATITGVNPQTLYSIIKRDSMSANIQDLAKVAHYLGVTLDYFYSAFLLYDTEKAATETANELCAETLQVAHAYEAADNGTKGAVRKLLDVDKLNDPIEAELASYRLELEAERKAKELSALGDTGENKETRRMA